MSALCVSCGSPVNRPKVTRYMGDPDAVTYAGPIQCGKCWMKATGDYPGRTQKQDPPSWLADVERRDKVDHSAGLTKKVRKVLDAGGDSHAL